ncbi:MAG: amidase family protein, partial [Pseudomonadota bacterium]
PDVDETVRAAAMRLKEAGADVRDISIPAHATATSVMLVSMLEGTLATFNEMSGQGTIAKGHFQLDAISFYEKIRKERANDLPVTVKTVLLFALAMRNRYGIYYSAKAQNIIRDVRASYNKALNDVDILLMPTTTMKALPIPPEGASEIEIMTSALPMIGNTAPFDATGHPSMSLPAGFSDGLPVGLMLTGRHGEDDVVLRAGHAVEQLSK